MDINLKTYLSQAHQRGELSGDLEYLLLEIAKTCQIIGYNVNRGGLLGLLGAQGKVNVQGEEQKQLDVVANDIMLQQLSDLGSVAAVASEEMQNCIANPNRQGRYLLVFDPLDGSSNIDINMSVGTIFSILPTPSGKKKIEDSDFLQPGKQQLAAGFCLFGPSTMLVLTYKKGVSCFVLNPENEQFVLFKDQLKIPKDTQEFAINSSNRRHWHLPIQKYIDDLLAGSNGERDKDFNMRWIASMVAEIYRVLSRGGIFMYPCDKRKSSLKGRLRLLYEGNPMALIVEEAGGSASTGQMRILDVEPQSLHDRVAVLMGSKHEVAVCDDYHRRYQE